MKSGVILYLFGVEIAHSHAENGTLSLLTLWFPAWAAHLKQPKDPI